MDRPSRSGAQDTLGPCTAPGPTTARPRTAPVKRMQVMGPFNSGTTLMHRYQNRLWRLANRHHGIAWKHSLPPAYRWQERSLWSQEEGGPSQELLESTVITCMVRLPYFWLTSTARDSYGLDLLDGGTWFGERIRSRVRLGEHTFENMVQLWNAYYGAYALYQLGGNAWREWERSLKSEVVPLQCEDGDRTGSWDPDGPWGYAGGRVYSTALATLTLQVYYRYGRLLGAR